VRVDEPRADHAHRSAVNGVCEVTVQGQRLLAAAGSDGTVRLWDPDTGLHHASLQGHRSAVNGVCEVTVHGQYLLATAGEDRTVRLWDPQTGTCVLRIITNRPALAVTWVTRLLAIGLDTGILMITADTLS
jgi:WD40 repeat protein